MSLLILKVHATSTFSFHARIRKFQHPVSMVYTMPGPNRYFVFSIKRFNQYKETLLIHSAVALAVA